MSSSRMRGDEEGNIDLNLSLSLNGRFGVDPNKRSSAILNEYGAELKMWPSIPTGTEVKEMGMGRKEEQSLALLNPNKRRRSLDSQGSSTISYFQNQTIEGQGFPAKIGCSMDKNQGKSVETGVKNLSSKAIPADQVEGRVFDNTPRVFTSIHGEKIAGFLSKYNEEEINIICACHGYSMTPAKFIKHAGGGDVANPERHIIISHAPGAGDGVNPLN